MPVRGQVEGLFRCVDMRPFGPSSGHLDYVREARRRGLEISNEPFVFVKRETPHRGHVLYRRFDGYYGLIARPTTTGQDPRCSVRGATHHTIASHQTRCDLL